MRTASVPRKHFDYAMVARRSCFPASEADERKFQQLPVWAISIPPRLRDPVSSASISDLADNLRSVGMLQPIIVRPHGSARFELIAGERRLRAAQLADLDVVPAMVLSDARASAEAVSLFENIHRENLSQFEEARVLERLLHECGSLEGVARNVNKSKAWVCERLQLLTLGPAARSLVADGVTSDVDVLNAVNRASRLDPDAAEILARQVREADKKRDVARRGLEVLKREIRLSVPTTGDSGGIRRDVGRLAAQIIRIGDDTPDPSTRARQFRQALSCSDNGCRDRLKALLESTFALGRAACSDPASRLNDASAELVELLHGKPRHLQQLMIRAFSVAAHRTAFDFQQVAIG